MVLSELVFRLKGSLSPSLHAGDFCSAICCSLVEVVRIMKSQLFLLLFSGFFFFFFLLSSSIWDLFQEDPHLEKSATVTVGDWTTGSYDGRPAFKKGKLRCHSSL